MFVYAFQLFTEGHRKINLPELNQVTCVPFNSKAIMFDAPLSQ